MTSPVLLPPSPISFDGQPWPQLQNPLHLTGLESEPNPRYQISEPAPIVDPDPPITQSQAYIPPPAEYSGGPSSEVPLPSHFGEMLDSMGELPSAVAGFEIGCLYYRDTVFGLPKFRVAQTPSQATETPVAICDSFGEGVYIKRDISEGSCSSECRCRQPNHWHSHSDFAFIVRKYTNIDAFLIKLQDHFLTDTIKDTMNIYPCVEGLDFAYWRSDDLLTHFNALEMHLQDIMHGTHNTDGFLVLRLLVDGFLRGLLPTDGDVAPRRDASDVLEDVMLLEETSSNEQEAKMCTARLMRLFAAANAQDWDAVLGFLRIDPGAVNACDAQGQTLLFYAVSAGRLDVVQRLHRQGADINWLDDEGETVLHRAARAGYRDVTDFLTGIGADVYAQNNRGETAAHMASFLCQSTARSILKPDSTVRPTKYQLKYF
ncbi:hypothetical protein ABW21_db0202590 [Orbilia brochopaga]|nr:hypothetical protein ABW21_db0202590 [Drechslerella brochopaga]